MRIAATTEVRLVMLATDLTPETRAFWAPYVGQEGVVDRSVDTDLDTIDILFEDGEMFPARLTEIEVIS